MKHIDQRLSIVGLGVENLALSTEFYERVFSWKKLPVSNENITFFQLNGILLSLYPRDKLAEDAGISPEGAGFRSFTLAHNTGSIEEVDELFQHFSTNNVTIIKKPEKVFWGGYSGYIADIDNHLWEIAYNPYMQFDAHGNVISE